MSVIIYRALTARSPDICSDLVTALSISLAAVSLAAASLAALVLFLASAARDSILRRRQRADMRRRQAAFYQNCRPPGR